MASWHKDVIQIHTEPFRVGQRTWTAGIVLRLRNRIRVIGIKWVR